MEIETRKILNKSFTGTGWLSIALLAGALVVFLAPIVVRGMGAFVFRSTVEFRVMQDDIFERGNKDKLEEDLRKARAAREPVYEKLEAFEQELEEMSIVDRLEYRDSYDELRNAVRELLGPAPGEERASLPRNRYGQTRMDRAGHSLHHLLYIETYDYSDPTRMGELIYEPRSQEFEGTALEGLFEYAENNFEAMMRPRTEFYWQFLIDQPVDSNIFGGIWPAILGTFYLTLGAIIFAVPMGVLSAIYLVEYAADNWMVSLLRTFVSTLAGVPSIVFGLFGLAFFINTIGVSESKSVLAGSLTLGLLILPMVIRSSEEAIRAVPMEYKEASLGLGAGKWRTVLTVILPSALPGIITGIIISMGRAAGETAPIIFTAAVSVGRALKPSQVFTNPTPALPWNIYNLATEHEMVDEIRHVQFGMVLTLIVLVLLLNMTAIVLRARISKKLKG